MTDIKWQEPPAGVTKGGRGPSTDHWPRIFAALRQNPGRWALVGEAVSASMASNIKQGSLAGGARGEFEAVSRKRDDGNKSDIYARFVGEVSA